jgi:hypothetical protein
VRQIARERFDLPVARVDALEHAVELGRHIGQFAWETRHRHALAE